MQEGEKPELTPSQLQAEFAALANRPPVAANFLQKFSEGMAAPLIGARFVLARKEYGRLLLMPVLLQTLISTSFIAVFVLVAWLLNELLSTLLITLVGWFWPEVSVETLNELSGVILVTACVFAACYVFMVIWRVTGGLFDDYYGDLVTSRVMEDLNITLHERRASAIRTAITAFSDAFFVSVGFMLLSPLGFIPVVGPLLTAVCGSLVAGFIHGSSQLRTPLQVMGLSRRQAFGICLRHRWAVIGLAFSRDLLGPIPVLGGAVNAFESIGRIFMASRLFSIDRSRIKVDVNQSMEQFLERFVPNELMTTSAENPGDTSAT